MREAKRKVSRRLPAQARKGFAGSPVPQQAAELMALAVEAAQSRHLPDFLQRFAERSMHMLGAAWCGVAVFRGRETELHLASGLDGSELTLGTKWLIERSRQPRTGVELLASDHDRGPLLEGSSQASNAVFVPIAASDGERLGTVCLLTARPAIGPDESRLLEALASHAA